jgi:hypothetical protein
LAVRRFVLAFSMLASIGLTGQMEKPRALLEHFVDLVPDGVGKGIEGVGGLFRHLWRRRRAHAIRRLVALGLKAKGKA